VEISVIVPTRNRSALLATTLRSVLRQRDVDLEVIVVDEASTDDTPRMLRALADARVRVIRHETPSGVAAARNRGAAGAHGDWLAFLDDDDLWAPDKLASQLHAAQQVGRDWAYTGAVVINIHGHILRVQRPLPPEEIVTALPRYNAVPGGGSSVVVRRATWMRIGPFDTRLRNTEDWEMWIRLGKHGVPACVSSPLIARRLHQSNSTLDVAEIVRGTQLIEALHQTTADWGRLHRWFAHSCLRAGRRWEAAGHFARAAVRGHRREVASDLSAILQRIVTGRTPASNDRNRDDAWIGMASAWIQDLVPPTPEGR
jgi:glycosyltransferase involved in cell wall biosynthesis